MIPIPKNGDWKLCIINYEQVGAPESRMIFYLWTELVGILGLIFSKRFSARKIISETSSEGLVSAELFVGAPNLWRIYCEHSEGFFRGREG